MITPKTGAEDAPAKKTMRMWTAGFLLTTVLCVGLYLSHGLQRLDNTFFDLQASTLRAIYPRTVSHEVVIVGIDEASTRAFEEPIILWHRHIADFLHAALDAEVSAIGLDVVLPDRSMNRFLPGHDEILMGAILNARRTAPFEIAITFDEVGAPRPIYPAFMAAAGDAGVGMAIFPRDRDQVVRRFDERLATDGTEVPTLAGNLARLLGASPGSGYIDYSIGSRFTYLPLHEVLKQAQAGNLAILRSVLKDKIVLLGAVIAGVDRIAQPVALAAWENDRLGAGVLIQAQALRTILNGGLLKPVGLPIMVFLIIATSLFWFIPLRSVMAGGILLVLVVGIFGAALLIQVNGSIFPLAAIVSSLTISIAGRQGVETFLRLSERRRLKLAFSGYVSPAIMREIVAGALTPSTKGSITIDAQGNSSFTGITSSAKTGSTGNAGSINIDAGTLLVDGTLISINALAGINVLAEAGSSGQTGNVFVNATESVTLSNGGALAIYNKATAPDPMILTQATLTVMAPTITLMGGRATATTDGNVNAGIVNVSATENLSIVSNGWITSSTWSSGNAGSVKINAGSITIDSQDNSTDSQGRSLLTGIVSILYQGSAGSAGTIEVTTAGNLSIVNGGKISASTFSLGDAGSIKINADSIIMDMHGGTKAPFIVSNAGLGSSGRRMAVSGT